MHFAILKCLTIPLGGGFFEITSLIMTYSKDVGIQIIGFSDEIVDTSFLRLIR